MTFASQPMTLLIKPAGYEIIGHISAMDNATDTLTLCPYNMSTCLHAKQDQSYCIIIELPYSLLFGSEYGTSKIYLLPVLVKLFAASPHILKFAIVEIYLAKQALYTQRDAIQNSILTLTSWLKSSTARTSVRSIVRLTDTTN